MLELVPNIGPTIAAVPAILVGFSLSPVHGVAALVVSLVVQQLENNYCSQNHGKSCRPKIPLSLSWYYGRFRMGGPLLAILSIPGLSLRVIHSISAQSSTSYRNRLKNRR